jgi:hypothetical protein
MKETNENASVPQRLGKLLSGAASSLYDRVTMNAEDYDTRYDEFPRSKSPDDMAMIANAGLLGAAGVAMYMGGERPPPDAGPPPIAPYAARLGGA